LASTKALLLKNGTLKRLGKSNTAPKRANTRPYMVKLANRCNITKSELKKTPAPKQNKNGLSLSAIEIFAQDFQLQPFFLGGGQISLCFG
jgi:hypothetical protein